jgi:uncharacterized coiled-coil protein SlyX
LGKEENPGPRKRVCNAGQIFPRRGMSERPEMNSHDEKSEKAKTLKGNQIMKNRNNPACNAVALRTGTFTTLLLALGFVALSPIAQAVVPSPDGGYPNFTTAEGTKALFGLTTGAANTAVGWFSLFSDAAGSFNTATGAGSLLFNTADDNTATGAAALLFNTTGSDNTAVGAAALVNNSTGEDNTAVGAFALNSNTASGNTAVGARTLLNNTTGGTLENIQGIDVGPNVAVGWQALESNGVTSANTAVGYQALHSFTTGPMGFEQLGLCTAVGFQALANATGGFDNNAFGYQALFNNTDGAGNTAIGPQALFNNDIGGDNVAIGSNSGHDITGDGNVCIGSDVPGFVGEDNTTRIRNIGSTPQGGGLTVTVESVAGTKLGYVPSSRRYKDDIKSIDKASEALFGLKPVTFRYKKSIDPTQMLAFGLIAEEVEKVNPDLVARNADGQPESVRYEYINAMLLNEFLKEHRKVQELESTAEKQDTTIAGLRCTTAEQETTIGDLKSMVAEQQESFQSQLAKQEKQMEALRSGLEKVSAQLELSKSRPQTVLNNQ